MSTEHDLDTRIRALVADAVAVAPNAPDLQPRATVTDLRPRRAMRWAIAGLTAAAAAVVLVAVLVTREPDQRITATSSTPPPSTTASWPSGVGILLASDRGIERVFAEGGSAVVQRTGVGEPVVLAIELADGTVVYQRADELIEVVRADGSSSGLSDLALKLIDADLVDGTVRVLYSALADGADPNIRRLWSWANREVTPHGDIFASVEQQFRLGPGDPAIPDLPAVLADLAAAAEYVDVFGDVAVLSYADRPGLLVDLRSLVSSPLPASGRATVIRHPVPDDGSVTPTTLLPPSTTASTTVPPLDFTGEVLTAGPDGVWLVGGFDPAQLTAQPMSFAVRAPDGSVIVQRRSGYGLEWAQSDTVPLVWRGADQPIEELLPGAVWADDVWIRLHDVAMVNGRMVLLYQVEHTPVPLEAGGSLVAYTFDTGETSVVADGVGGWEQGVSRLQLAANGLIVGEQFNEVTASLAVFGLPGAPSLTPAQLGLEASYSDCSTCPHAYTVSRDGGTIAWLEQRELVRWDLAAGAERDRTDLGTDDVFSAVDLDLGDDHVVISRWLPEGLPAPLLIQVSDGAVLELSGTSASLGQPFDPAFDPWTDEPDITAAHAGTTYATIEELRAAVEQTILLGYPADDRSQVSFRTGESIEPSVVVILAPTFDDSVETIRYEVTVVDGAGQLSVLRVRSAGMCRGGGFSAPARLCP